MRTTKNRITSKILLLVLTLSFLLSGVIVLVGCNGELEKENTQLRSQNEDLQDQLGETKENREKWQLEAEQCSQCL